jgi:hypothetical protein
MPSSLKIYVINVNIKIPDTYIQAYVFIELSSNIYRRIFIDNFNVGDKEVKGIKIESIFFSNIDNDSDKELGIIISQITGEGDTIDYEGTLFFTKFYDKPNYYYYVDTFRCIIFFVLSESHITRMAGQQYIFID